VALLMEIARLNDDFKRDKISNPVTLSETGDRQSRISRYFGALTAGGRWDISIQIYRYGMTV
jgi:hypothetical protein